MRESSRCWPTTDGSPATADREMFEALQRELRDYWQTMEPVLSWSPEQRRRQGFRFLRRRDLSAALEHLGDRR